MRPSISSTTQIENCAAPKLIAVKTATVNLRARSVAHHGESESGRERAGGDPHPVLSDLNDYAMGPIHPAPARTGPREQPLQPLWQTVRKDQLTSGRETMALRWERF